MASYKLDHDGRFASTGCGFAGADLENAMSDQTDDSGNDKSPGNAEGGAARGNDPQRDDKTRDWGGKERQSAIPGIGVSQRRKRPATIELEASDVTPQDAPQTSADTPDQQPSGDAAPRPDAADPSDTDNRPPPPDTPIDPPAAPRNSTLLPLVGAGLVGGIVCALALLALLRFGFLQSNNDANAAFAARLDQIDRALAEPPASPDLSRLEQQLATLTRRLQASEQAAAKITPLDEKIAAAQSAADQARADLSALAQTLSGMGDDGTDSGAALAAMGQQLAALKSELASLARILPAGGDLAARDGALNALRQRIADLERAPRAESDGQSATAASALALSALDRAVRSGRPYRGELDTARALIGEDAAFATLEATASSGVATREQLAAAFEPLAGAIVAASRQRDDDTLLARLLSKAKSLIQIRPVGYVDGDGAEAAVARAESHLREGDLESAVSELTMLQGRARDTAIDFIARAEARLRAEQASNALNARTLSALGGLGTQQTGEAQGQ